MRRVILCAFLALAGCATQSHERIAKYDPDGKVLEKSCKTKSTSLLNLTEVEALNAKIGCADDQVTEIGVGKLSRKGDTAMFEGISEGITTGVMKGLGVAAGNPAAVIPK